MGRARVRLAGERERARAVGEGPVISGGAAAADRWDRGDSAAHRDGRTAEKWTPTIGT